MRARYWILLFVVSASPWMAGCRSSGGQDTVGSPSWTRPEPHPLLKSCAATRESYYPMICPTVYTPHVLRSNGQFVKTFDELRPLLKPIETREQALAYRRLLGDIEIQRDETLKQLQWARPLDFHDGDKPSYGVYVAADAARWNVGREALVAAWEDRFVITQPAYRMVETIDENGKAWVLGEGVVELVRETIHRDGRYEREVVRVLEEGQAAAVYQPAPLL